MHIFMNISYLRVFFEIHTAEGKTVSKLLHILVVGQKDFFLVQVGFGEKTHNYSLLRTKQPVYAKYTFYEDKQVHCVKWY